MDNLLNKDAVKRVQKSLSSFDDTLKVQVLEQSARTAKDAATVLKCEVGAIVKSLLLKTDDEFIFGRHNQDWEALNEDGEGTNESWRITTPRVQMGLDDRIPILSSPGGGTCSKITFEIANPTYISGVEYLADKSIDPSTGGPTASGRKFYLQLKNSALPNLKYGGGQVAIKKTLSDIDPITGDPKIVVEVQSVRYVGEPKIYTMPGPGGVTDTFSFIELSIN